MTYRNLFSLQPPVPIWMGTALVSSVLLASQVTTLHMQTQQQSTESTIMPHPCQGRLELTACDESDDAGSRRAAISRRNGRFGVFYRVRNCSHLARAILPCLIIWRGKVILGVGLVASDAWGSSRWSLSRAFPRTLGVAARPFSLLTNTQGQYW